MAKSPRLHLVSADEEIQVKALVKWGLIAFAGLVVLAALFDTDENPGQPTEATAASESSDTQKATPTETSTREPPPKPEVALRYTGPSTVHSDDVVLKGTVDPPRSHVRVKGHSVPVRNGRWKLPVTLSGRGDNTFRFTATRKGYVRSTITATVTRKLSAAERAAIRRERAERRANRRALEAAESYLALSGFSKQGLYEQLSSSAGEGFTESEASYAVDHVDADWNQEQSSRRGATWTSRRCRGAR